MIPVYHGKSVKNRQDAAISCFPGIRCLFFNFGNRMNYRDGDWSESFRPYIKQMPRTTGQAVFIIHFFRLQNDPASDRISSVTQRHETRLMLSVFICITAFHNSNPYAHPVFTDSYVFPSITGTGYPGSCCCMSSSIMRFLHILEYLVCSYNP